MCESFNTMMALWIFLLVWTSFDLACTQTTGNSYITMCFNPDIRDISRTCPDSGSFRIIEAFHGQIAEGSSVTCPAPVHDPSLPCTTRDNKVWLTSLMREKCNHFGQCLIPISLYPLYLNTSCPLPSAQDIIYLHIVFQCMPTMFTLSLTEVCTGTSGSNSELKIINDSYPGRNALAVTCVIDIRPPPGGRVTLTFYDLSVDTSCRPINVIVHGNGKQTKYCNVEEETKISGLTDEVLRVYFVSETKSVGVSPGQQYSLRSWLKFAAENSVNPSMMYNTSHSTSPVTLATTFSNRGTASIIPPNDVLVSTDALAATTELSSASKTSLDNQNVSPITTIIATTTSSTTTDTPAPTTTKTTIATTTTTTTLPITSATTLTTTISSTSTTTQTTYSPTTPANPEPTTTITPSATTTSRARDNSPSTSNDDKNNDGPSTTLPTSHLIHNNSTDKPTAASDELASWVIPVAASSTVMFVIIIILIGVIICQYRRRKKKNEARNVTEEIRYSMHANKSVELLRDEPTFFVPQDPTMPYANNTYQNSLPSSKHSFTRGKRRDPPITQPPVIPPRQAKQDRLPRPGPEVHSSAPNLNSMESGYASTALQADSLPRGYRSSPTPPPISSSVPNINDQIRALYTPESKKRRVVSPPIDYDTGHIMAPSGAVYARPNKNRTASPIASRGQTRQSPEPLPPHLESDSRQRRKQKKNKR